METPLPASPETTPAAEPRLTKSPPVLDSSILGMLVFTVTETMFFVGCISAFTISKAGTMVGNWPPPGQPVLEPGSTIFNTAALILSGIVLLVANWQFKKSRALESGFASSGPVNKAVNTPEKWLVLSSFILGALFVALQGGEWTALLKQGLTLTSSPAGSFFYLIVGGHALHATVALCAMLVLVIQAFTGGMKKGLFYAVQTFWYFVVLMWPVIYSRVYF
jgi:cytochrome c oxidase subunit III